MEIIVKVVQYNVIPYGTIDKTDDNEIRTR